MIKVKLVIVMIVIVLSLVSCDMIRYEHDNIVTRGTSGKIWKPVYLRTPDQKEAGIPGGEGMAFVFSISYAPSNPNIAYFVSDHSGVWRGERKEKGELKDYPHFEGYFWKSKRGYYNRASQAHKGFRPIGGISLAVDPLNENIVFVSGTRHTKNRRSLTELSGIYRTLNGGNSWDHVYITRYITWSGGRRLQEGSHFVFDPDENNIVCDLPGDKCRHMTIYAATHEGGLLKSTEGGGKDSWTILTEINGTYIFQNPTCMNNSSCGKIFLEDTRISDLEIVVDGDMSKAHKRTGVILYAATESGLHKIVVSDNGRTTVETTGDLPDYPRTIAIDSRKTNIIYAALGPSKVFKSVDNGKTFIKKSKGLRNVINEKLRGYTSIDISKTNPDHLYVYSNYHPSLKNPYYSLDGGETWKELVSLDESGLMLMAGSPSFGNAATHPTDPLRALRPFDSPTMIGGTVDGGKTWQYSSNGFMGATRWGDTSVYFGPIDKSSPDIRKLIYFIGDFGPVLSSDGGKSWKFLFTKNVASSRATPVGLVLPGSGRLIVSKGAFQGYISISDNDGSTWTVFNGGDEGGTQYSDQQGNIYKAPAVELYARFLKQHPQNVNYVYAGGQDTSWISRDGGSTWGSWDESGTWTNNALQKGIAAVLPGNGDIIYAFKRCPYCLYNVASGCDAKRKNQTVLWVSKDKGKTWEAINCIALGIPGSSTQIYSMDIDPEDSNRLYLASSKGLFIFDNCDDDNDNDCTDDWIEIKGTYNDQTYRRGSFNEVKSIAIDPNKPNVVYIGLFSPYDTRKEFIYRSEDKGITWNNIRYNLDNYANVYGLTVDPVTSVLHMSTAQYGNYVLCTDTDGDESATEGGLCGAVDINDTDSQISSIQDLSSSTNALPNGIELTWTCAVSNGSYNIYRSSTQGGPYELVSRSSNCHYSNREVQGVSSHYYIVRYANIYGQESRDSNEVSTESLN